MSAGDPIAVVFRLPGKGGRSIRSNCGHDTYPNSRSF